MPEKQEGSPARGWSIGAALRNAVLAALLVLLLMCCWLAYRVATIMHRVEQATAAVSEDMKAVTTKVAAHARDVADIRAEITSLKDKAKQSVVYAEIREAFDAALNAGAPEKAEPPAAAPAAKEEIQALLKALLASGCRGEVGGKEQSCLKMYARLYAKYRLRPKSVWSAEDFIAQFGPEASSEKAYFLFEPDGKRVPLADWMRDRLARIRAEAAEKRALPAAAPPEPPVEGGGEKPAAQP